jgi:hypothetical protein
MDAARHILIVNRWSPAARRRKTPSTQDRPMPKAIRIKEMGGPEVLR